MTGEAIVDDGLAGTAELIRATYGWMSFGTGTTDPTKQDTALENEVLRKEATVTRDGNVLTWTCTVNPGEINATITELGVHKAATPTAGDMYRRETREAVLIDTTHGSTFQVQSTVGRSEE